MVKQFKVFLTVLFMIVMGSAFGLEEGDKEGAILEGIIAIHPTRPIPEGPERIQPGTAVDVSLTIKNTGTKDSPVGDVIVRYAFAKPLEKHPHSVLFQTEKQAVPVLKAGEEFSIKFKTQSPLPTLFDFVREDWIMREYQAIFSYDKGDRCLGVLPLTVSAYYYAGEKREVPAAL